MVIDYLSRLTPSREKYPRGDSINIDCYVTLKSFLRKLTKQKQSLEARKITMARKYFHFSVANFLSHFSGTTGAAEGFYDISREPYWGAFLPPPQKTELITSPKNAFTATSHNDFVLKCIFPGDIGRYILGDIGRYIPDTHEYFN